MGYKNMMANSKPLLSVIIPIYNVQGYVAAALQYLQEQSFTDFEAILVEDQSSDESLAVFSDLPNRTRAFALYNTKLTRD